MLKMEISSEDQIFFFSERGIEMKINMNKRGDFISHLTRKHIADVHKFQLLFQTQKHIHINNFL